MPRPENGSTAVFTVSHNRRAAFGNRPPLRSVRFPNALFPAQNVYTMLLHTLFTILLLTQWSPLRVRVRCQGEDVTRLSETLADGFNADMKAAANEDIKRILGGEKYITNERTAKGLATEIHTMIAKGDANLAQQITPDKLEKAVHQGT